MVLHVRMHIQSTINVPTSRHLQPQPAGHTSMVSNHVRRWYACPPWPHATQKLLAPLTATWHITHWSPNDLQEPHWAPRSFCEQLQQRVPNSTPLWGGCGSLKNLVTSALLPSKFQRYRTSAYCFMKWSCSLSCATSTNLQSFSYCFHCSSLGSFVLMKTGGDHPPLGGNDTSLHSFGGESWCKWSVTFPRD